VTTSGPEPKEGALSYSNQEIHYGAVIVYKAPTRQRPNAVKVYGYLSVIATNRSE
jgi:hypothetical protein